MMSTYSTLIPFMLSVASVYIVRSMYQPHMVQIVSCTYSIINKLIIYIHKQALLICMLNMNFDEGSQLC